MQRVTGAAGVAVVGANYRTAGIAERERLLAAASRLGVWHAEGQGTGLPRELLLVTTCNRVEVCLAGLDIDRAVEECRSILASPAIEVHSGFDAVRHLCRVAAGLESMVLGEHEISGQLRRAAAAARAAGTIGVCLDRIVAGALGAAGRVRAETALGRGGLSVAAAATTFAERAVGDWLSAPTLVVGAGPVAREILSRWSRRGHANLAIASRSITHAERVAGETGATIIPLDRVPAALSGVDIAFTAVRTPGWILDAGTCRDAAAHRTGRPLLVLDLSVPRAVESPGVVPGLAVHTVDDIGDVRLAAARERRRAIPAATRIVEDEATRAYRQFHARVTRIRGRAA